MPRDKLQSSLVPLGFRSTHAQMLDEVLQWVRDGAVVPSLAEQEEVADRISRLAEELSPGALLTRLREDLVKAAPTASI